MIHPLPATSYQPPATSYQLPVTSYQLPAASYQHSRPTDNYLLLDHKAKVMHLLHSTIKENLMNKESNVYVNIQKLVLIVFCVCYMTHNAKVEKLPKH